MADNETTGTGKAVATDKVTYSGDADQNVQLVRGVQVTGSEGAKTVVDLPGDALHGRYVQVSHQSNFDIFNRAKFTSDNNDIDVQFFRDDPEKLVKITTANSATATANVGGALFSSSTNANGSVQGVSNQTTVYRSGSEIYCIFTAAFSAGIASSYMRLGLYDANNGFFVGYEGTSFGITVRNNAVDSTVAKGDWNEDTLTGAATSRFTRAGTPEAIDLTKLNVYRIRFGWLGSAPVFWEVMAPDGHWVVVHKTLFPNSQATPSIRDADLPMTLDITKTSAAATDITIQTDCWGAGTASGTSSAQEDRFGFQTTTTLANGATYDSGVLSLSPKYSQVQTTVNASHDGDITILWYTDAGGANLERTLAIPYTASSGFQLFAAPAFTPYVRYQFTNDSGSAQTNFHFDTKFMQRPISPQILRIDGTIVGGMVATLSRSLIAGETTGGGGGYVNVKVNPSGNLSTTADTELPAAAALADDTANPTAPAVGSFGHVWDGATWDRQPGTAADGTLVNLGSNNDVTVSSGTITTVSTVTAVTTVSTVTNLAQLGGQAVSMGTGVRDAGTQRVTIATDDVVPASQSGTWTVDLGATDNAVLDTIETNTDFGTVVGGGTEATALRVTLANDSTGVVSIDDNAGSITVDNGGTFAVQAAQSGTWTVQPGNTANTTPWLVTQTPATSGGLTTYHLVSAATTNATVIKASAGQVFGWYIYNSNASARKIAFHNTASTPTAGASVYFSLVIPPASGANVEMANGIAFSTGIAFTTVTGLADSDATAVAANDLIINIFYK